jgi:hypothetical protein
MELVSHGKVKKKNGRRKCYIRGSGDLAPSFLTTALNGGVVSFKLCPLYPHGNGPPVLTIMLSRPQSWSGHCDEEKNLLSLPGIEPRPSSSYPVAI